MIEDKIICKKSDLTSIADTVRSKLGVTDTYYVSELSDAIERIPTGTQLPTLTNPGSASDILSGKELIDQNGNKITGTIATKTSSNLTASGATVTVPAGYYASSASKSVSTATQATPSITVNSSGLITASATQSAGYVSSGTKSATKQLATKAAATITPGTTNQTIPANTYLTGAQTIKGDANLIASNIKSGVSIFGVTGTASGGGGSGESKLPQFVDGTFTEITAEDLQGATKIRGYAFYHSSLTSVTIPNSVTSIDTYAFSNCSSLTSVTIPNSVTSIDTYAFSNCSSLTSVTIPNSVTSLGSSAFYTCKRLTKITIPNNVTSIRNSTFAYCSRLTSVTIGNSVTSIGVEAFRNCTGLTSVTIGNGVTSIRTQAFRYCTSLTRITIPDSVTSIDTYALQIGSSSNKATITMKRTTPPTIKTSTFSTSYLNKIIVPAGTGNTYKSATNWANFASYIEEAAS